MQEVYRDLAMKFTNLIRNRKLDHTKTDLSAIPDNLIQEICENEETATLIAVLYFTMWAVHHKGDRKRGTVCLSNDEMESGCSYFLTKFGLESLKRRGLLEYYIFQGEPLDEDFDIEIKLKEGMNEDEAERIIKKFPKAQIH